MTQAQPTPAGWNPDPFGRYQWRYWDGARWTDQVATNGQQATDPPTGEIPKPDRSALDAPAIVLVYQGDEAQSGWPVFVGDTQVARVAVDDQFFGVDQYLLTDLGGRPLVHVRATSTMNPEYVVSGGGGAVLGIVAPPQGLIGRQAYEVLGADRSLLARAVGESMVDGSGRPIARLTNGQEQISFLKTRAWMTLERDPALSEPSRTVLIGWVVAAYEIDQQQRAAASRRRRRRRSKH